ncbi:ABC-F family ATP-binding cassette domain-containing protein [bacterium]|nr:ABC-F family ATP-binding cassette domain-containing protein [bacterium]
MPDFIYINNLSFTYDNSVEFLFDKLSFQLEKGWTGVVGASGSGKTTLLKLLTAQLIPDTGSLNLPRLTYYCEQRTDFIPSGLKDFLQSTENRAFKIRAALEIQEEWEKRWDVLSHGERKRCQISVALYQNPSLLAIDEPSNHLDYTSKMVLLNALRSYNGVGILVSHDRELLDNLCNHTLFLVPPNIDLRNCSYSIAAHELERENAASMRADQLARQEVKKLKKKVNQQREKARQADRQISKGKVSIRDHDAKAKKDLARLTGKDAVAGKIQKRLQTQLYKSIDLQQKIKFNKETKLGISFRESKGKKIFPIIIPPGRISLGPEKILRFPELTIRYGDKIGISGNNGSGKSTFIEYLLKTAHLSGSEVIYIPQEISVEQSKAMIRRVQNFKNETKGKMMTLICRLGSDPKHLIETTIPSPGEVRKLLLAEGIMLNPGLIIMDEPTNHMDLPSIQCVEDALKKCQCAQLLVSHDQVFLENIVFEYWSFSNVSKEEFRIVVN